MIKHVFQFDIMGICHTIAVLRGAMQDISAPLEEVGENLLYDLGDSFQREESPFGEKWAPLAESTKKHKKDSRILYKTGVLMDSISSRGAFGNLFKLQKTFLDIGSNIGYGSVHQFGSKDGRIKKRSFVGISEEHVHMAESVYLDWLNSLLGKKGSDDIDM